MKTLIQILSNEMVQGAMLAVIIYGFAVILAILKDRKKA